MRYLFTAGKVSLTNPEVFDLGGVELTFNEGLVTFTNLSHQPKAVKIYDQRDLEGEDDDDDDEDGDDNEFEAIPVYEFDVDLGESVSKVLVQMEGEEIVPIHYVLRTYTRVPTEQEIAISNLSDAVAEMFVEAIAAGDVDETFLEPECEFQMTVEDDLPKDKLPEDDQNVTLFATTIKIVNIPPGDLAGVLNKLNGTLPTGTSAADAAALSES